MSCPLCRNESVESPPDPKLVERASFNCPVCRNFEATGECLWLVIDRLTPQERTSLSGFSFERKLRGQPPPVFVTDAARPRINCFTADDAIAAAPKQISDKLDHVLEILKILGPNFGQEIVLTPKDAPLGYVADFSQLNFLLTALQEAGFIEMVLGSVYDEDLAGNRHTDVIVKPAGWNRLAEIERGKMAANSRNVFVAMWLDSEKFGQFKNCKESLKAGIHDAGYKPDVFEPETRDQFVGGIDDEAIARIRKCRFVVADLTGERPAVYYEAGFAQALGKVVIFTVQRNATVHFYQSQDSYIDWADAEDLRKRLKSKIERVIGRPYP